MLSFFLVFCVFVNHLQGANILGVFYHAGKSHHYLGETLLKTLARKGHNVTMASPFPLSQPFPNYTDIYLTGIQEDQLTRESNFIKINESIYLTETEDALELARVQGELTLDHVEMRKLEKSGTKFDLVILDLFFNPSHMVYGWIFQAPVIYVCSHGTSILVSNLVGSPAPPSYVPQKLLPFSDKMNLMERSLNTVITAIYKIVGLKVGKVQQEILDKYHPGAPKIPDLWEDHFALVLSNGHYSFETPRPMVPNVIPVGGFHITAPGNLPKDIQEFMDSAENGVIFFSLGSQVKSVLLPSKKQAAIRDSFRNLSQKVLWKWEEETMPEKPGNLMVRKWFPQNEILAHPNLKLFITHGGQLSTIEALHYGIPVLGIPIYGDQKSNLKSAVVGEYAVELELANLNRETFSKALEEILENSKYLENARKRSALLRDQPIPPMDSAVFWVEHVLRHKGGKHLRNQGFYLPWYQYWMLDAVFLFILTPMSIALLMSYIVLNRVFKYLGFCQGEKSRDTKLKKS